MAANREQINLKAKTALMWLASTSSLLQICSWLLTLVTARILTPKEYGLFALAETVIPYFTLLCSFNISSWLIQRSALTKEEEDTAFTTSLILAIISSLLAFFLAKPLATFYEKSELISIMQSVALLFLLQGVQTIATARLHRKMEFKPIAIINLTVGVTRGVLQLVLALSGFGYWSLVLGLIFQEFIKTIWLSWKAGLPNHLFIEPQAFKAILKFGSTATAAVILWIIYSTADNILIGKLFSTEILGLYAMAYYLTDLPLAKINSIVRPLLLPYYSQMKSSYNELRVAFLHTARLYGVAAFPCFIGIAVTAQELVVVLLGSNWGGLTTPLFILAGVGVWRVFSIPIEPLLIALNQPGRVFQVNLFAVITLVPGFALLGANFGLNGIYATWLLIYPLTVAFNILQMSKGAEIAISSYLKQFFPPLGAALLMGVTVYLFELSLFAGLSPMVVLAAKIIMGVTSYLFYLWVISSATLLKSR